MDSVFNPSAADATGALLILTLAVTAILLTRWSIDGSGLPLLRRMIGRAGGKPDDEADPLPGENQATAAQDCPICRNRDECEAAAEDFDGEIPEYCPNRR